MPRNRVRNSHNSHSSSSRIDWLWNKLDYSL